MNYYYPLCNKIDLYIKDRISLEDANRQLKTAKEILIRLYKQPGVILADEVGMGKTFVALAVAVSVALVNHNRRPVVVMVPPSLREKWPADFNLFKESCIKGNLRDTIKCATANRAIEFFKLLDDPPPRRKSIIFMTHGALNRGLHDRWIMLALIYQATKNRKNVNEFRRVLSRVLGRLLDMKWIEINGQEIWINLLETPPEGWRQLLYKWDVDPEHDNNPVTDDDPVRFSIF